MALNGPEKQSKVMVISAFPQVDWLKGKLYILVCIFRENHDTLMA